MANKRAKQKKPKQQNKTNSSSKGGSMSFEDLGSPKQTKKKKKS